MKVIRLRQARYCNLKLLLLLLLVYGHMIEPCLGQSETLTVLYRWIYLIHMPLFSFLSGLFLKDAAGCRRQLLRLLPIYLLSQALACLLGGGVVKPLTPFWHLWYLLSCSLWLGFAWLWFKLRKGRGGVAILILAVLMGCAAGWIPWVGRTLSLSRTLVFFPYFWAGLLMEPAFRWRRLLPWGLLAFAAAALWLIYRGSSLPLSFLYQAAPYGKLNNGFLLRLRCYGLSTGLGLFLLAAIPVGRHFCTKLGTDTLPCYLLHAPLVYWLRSLELCRRFPLLSSILVIAFLYALTKWRGRLYGILPEERRERPCLRFSRFMRPTQSRSIASS